MNELHFSVTTNAPQDLSAQLGIAFNKIPNSSEVKDIGTLKLTSMQLTRGMTQSDMVISFMISVAANVTTNMIASWIKNCLVDKNHHVHIGSDPEFKTTISEITEAIEDEIPRKSGKAE